MIYKCSENYVCEFLSVLGSLQWRLVFIVLIFRGLKWQKWTFRLCVQSWKPLNLIVNKIRRTTVLLDFMHNHFPGVRCAWVGNLNPVWKWQPLRMHREKVKQCEYTECLMPNIKNIKTPWKHPGLGIRIINNEHLVHCKLRVGVSL